MPFIAPEEHRDGELLLRSFRPGDGDELNRARYDATRTIAAFSARLREEVDLDTLSAELLAVTAQTVQPTTMSLWLRARP